MSDSMSVFAAAAAVMSIVDRPRRRRDLWVLITLLLTDTDAMMSGFIVGNTKMQTWIVEFMYGRL